MLYRYFFENSKGERIDFSPFGDIIALKVDGVNGNEVDLATTKGVNQIGDTVTSRNVNSRPILIDGTIRGDLEHNRKILIKVLKPQITGILYAINTRSNDIYKIDVEIKKSPVIGFGLNTMNFQVSLYAPYPYWKEDKTSSVDIRKLIPLFRFPRNFNGTWKISEFQRSEFIKVVNEGTEDIGMKIIFKAKTIVKNPKLLNVTTMEYIRLNYEFEAGEVVTITTGYNNKKIISNKKGNIFKHLDLLNSTFLQLVSGENIFKFTAEENEYNMDVVLYYDEVVSGI